MKKIFFFIMLICFVYPLFAEDKPTLTVLDFSVNGISEQDMNSIISFLSASLFDTGLYRVIDTAQRDTILQELSFSNTGCTDESCQLEIGRLLSAELIVTGDVAKVGSRYVFTARMIETETSETLSTSKAIYQSPDQLIDGSAAFARRLASIDDATAAAAGVHVDSPEPVTEAVTFSAKRIAAWATLGVGAAAAGLGGFLIYNALAYKSGTVDPALAAYNTEDTSLFGTKTAEQYYESAWNSYSDSFNVYKGKAVTSLIVTGAGLVSLGVSAVLFLLPDKTENPDVSFMMLPQADACSFAGRIRL